MHIHRAPDWTPEVHNAADGCQLADELLRQAKTIPQLEHAVRVHQEARYEFGKALLELDKIRRPGFYR